MALDFQLILDVANHISNRKLPRFVCLVGNNLTSAQVAPSNLLALLPPSCLNHWRKGLLVRSSKHLSDATLVILNLKLKQAPARPNQDLLQGNVRAFINQLTRGRISQNHTAESGLPYHYVRALARLTQQMFRRPSLRRHPAEHDLSRSQLSQVARGIGTFDLLR